MEQSLAAILKHREKTHLLEELETESLKLTEVERMIIKARLSGLSFCQFEEKELKEKSDMLILSTAAVSGCSLPQTDFFADLIVSELIIFLRKFGYGELTYEELLLAIRINCKGGLRFPSGLEIERISNIGNCFNIDYLARVLSNYMALRNILDGKFKNRIDGY